MNQAIEYKKLNACYGIFMPQFSVARLNTGKIIFAFSRDICRNIQA